MKQLALSAVVVLAVMIALCGNASPAHAQSGRTFVSGSGADAGTCGRSAPCRTFAYAITQTNAGGEIAVLDTAGYGSVTINKAISIVNPGGVEAGISVSQGNTAIIINAGPTETVALRGLTLEGAGTGSTGIAMGTGGRLEIMSCVIRDFTDVGISVLAENSLSVVISKTAVLDNANTGIALFEYSGGGPLIATLDHVIADNNQIGISVIGGSQPVEALISESHIDNNTEYGLFAGQPGAKTDVVLQNSTLNQTPTAIYLAGSTNLWLSHVIQTAVPGFSNVGIAAEGGNDNVYSDGTSHFNSGSLQGWGFQ